MKLVTILNFINRVIFIKGFVGVSYLIEDIYLGLEDLEKEILNGASKEDDTKGYNLLKKMFFKYSTHLIDKEKIRDILENHKYISPKFHKLLQTIKNKGEEITEPTIIIFVNKRIIAKYLNNVLQLYYPKKVGYIVGYSKGGKKKIKNSVNLEIEYVPDSDIKEMIEEKISFQNEDKNNQKTSLKNYFEDKFTIEQQMNVINDFKEKKINYLISTSVAEEGFDVPHCNLVLSYNDDKTIRSFIQLKGRARKKNSEFLIFAPEILVFLKFIIHFHDFLMIRKELLKKILKLMKN